MARQGCGNASYWTKAKTQVNKGNKARMKYDNFVYNGGGNFLLGHPPYISHHWWLYLVQGRYVPSMTLFVRQSNMATCTNTMADISHLDFLDIFLQIIAKPSCSFFLQLFLSQLLLKLWHNFYVLWCRLPLLLFAHPDSRKDDIFHCCGCIALC